MSSSRIGQEVQDKYNKIQDALLRIKPHLNAVSAPELAIEELTDIASLAESITTGLSKFGKTSCDGDDAWKKIADTLDREGVNLWNASGLLRHSKSTSEDDSSLKVLAAARLAAFRLIDAGLEHNPTVDTLVHTLQIASKTAVAIAQCGGKEELALSILTRAAQMEQDLRKMTSLDEPISNAKTAAVVCYYTSRMEVALVARQDEDQAFYMLEQITDADERRLASVTPHDLEVLAAKVLDMGKFLLRQQHSWSKPQDENRPDDLAVKWMQKAFSLVEKIPEESSSSGITYLKQNIMRTLARAYYLSSDAIPEYLGRAEVTLAELLHDGTESEEAQQLRYMYLAVLRKRKASDLTLLEAFNSIVDHLAFAEADVNDALRELKSITQELASISPILIKLLRKALSADENAGDPFVERIVMSLLFVCSRESNSQIAVREVTVALDCLTTGSSYELPATPCTACQSLIWQFGEQQYASQQWPIAAEWYLTATHAAICFIESQNYARALELVRKCQTNEASTHYVQFLVASYQGLEEEASAAVADMIKAPDFDRRMLLLAVQVAHESKQKLLLLSVLRALFDTVSNPTGGILPNTEETILHTSIILRCTVRLILEMLEVTPENIAGVVDLLVSQLNIVLKFVDETCTRGGGTVISKDISWFWRTTYNVAVGGCSEWDACENQISSLFSVVEKLIGICVARLPEGSDPELREHRAYAAFCSITGRVFAARLLQEGDEKMTSLHSILESISGFRKYNWSSPSKDKEETRRIPLENMLFVFELEIMIDLSLWSAIGQLIEETSSKDHLTLDTFEAAVGALWKAKGCPLNVLQSALESVLRTVLENEAFSVLRFSHWLRVICVILLSRNSPSDQQKVISYIEDALDVIKDHEAEEPSEQCYPVEERYWLLSTTYNNGVECLSTSARDSAGAQRWFELALILCRHVPDGKLRSEKVESEHTITQAYKELLSRYQTT